jgi:hypothetical protein
MTKNSDTQGNQGCSLYVNARRCKEIRVQEKRKKLIKSETQNTKVYMEGHTVQTFH